MRKQEDIPIPSPVLKSTQAVQKHSSQPMCDYLEYKKILDLKEYYHVQFYCKSTDRDLQQKYRRHSNLPVRCSLLPRIFWYISVRDWFCGECHCSQVNRLGRS